MPKNDEGDYKQLQLDLWPKSGPEVVTVVAPSPKRQDPDLSQNYWDKCYRMLVSWGPYVGRQGLLDNASDERKRHRVWHVVEQKFGGRINSLEDRVKVLKQVFMNDYALYVKACEKCGVEAVSVKWLRSHLWDGDDIKSYRSRCRTYATKPEKYPPQSLSSLPPRKSRKK